jgi:hypothetical protein
MQLPLGTPVYKSVKEKLGTQLLKCLYQDMRSQSSTYVTNKLQVKCVSTLLIPAGMN